MVLRSLIWATICLPALLCTCDAAGKDGYRGKPLGKLSQLNHGVSGEVYAVDARTLHIRNFNYDGEGPAAYFYVGTSKAVSGSGIRLRDERGTTNVLPRYRNQDITLSLPEGKTLQNIKWFSVWCDEFSVNFGDVRIPKGFEFPRPHKLGTLSGIHGVSSDQVVIVDAQTLLIPNFSYDGEAPDAKFWVGQGSRPTPQGIRIPDENGKSVPLRRYDRKTIVLTLPGDMTVFDINYFGVWCEAFAVDFGHVLLPQGLNVPPSLKMLGVSPQSKLNCEVLWDDLAYEVRWAVAGDSIVLQLVARLENGEYMAFGISGDESRSKMVGGDVTVAWVDKETLKGQAKDYFLDAKSQCSGTRGSCPDEKIAEKTNSVRLLNAALVNGYSIVTYQRSLKAQDEFDRHIYTNGTQPVIWAIGPLNSRQEVSYHSIANRADILLDFGRPPKWNCPTPEAQSVPSHQPEPIKPQRQKQQTTTETALDTRHQSSNRRESARPKTPTATPAPAPKNKPWDIPAIQCDEPEDGVFYAQMGPTGGKHGYPAITGHVGWGISWYINGLLIPEINVVRGRTYTFIAEGGLDSETPARYHPFYITDDPVGGYEYKTPEERAQVQIFAGAVQNKKGEVRPTGVGRLCIWVQDQTQPPADDFSSFGAFQRILRLECDQGEPGIVQWTVANDTPDTVYYQCYTHRYLGWKINVLDACEEAAGSGPQPVFVKPPFETIVSDEEPEAQASIQHISKVRPDSVSNKIHAEIPNHFNSLSDQDLNTFNSHQNTALSHFTSHSDVSQNHFTSHTDTAPNHFTSHSDNAQNHFTSHSDNAQNPFTSHSDNAQNPFTSHSETPNHFTSHPIPSPDNSATGPSPNHFSHPGPPNNVHAGPTSHQFNSGPIQDQNPNTKPDPTPVTYVPVPEFHFYNEETGEPLDQETIHKMNLEQEIQRLQSQFYQSQSPPPHHRPEPAPQEQPLGNTKDDQFLDFFHTPKPMYSVEENPEEEPAVLSSQQFQITPQTERPYPTPTTKAKPLHFETTTAFDDKFSQEFLRNYQQLQMEAAAKLKKHNHKMQTHNGKPTRLQYSAPRRPSSPHHALTLQQRPLPPGMFRPPFLPPPNKKNYSKRPGQAASGSQKVATYANINNIPNRPNNYIRPQKPHRHPEPTNSPIRNHESTYAPQRHPDPTYAPQRHPEPTYSPQRHPDPTYVPQRYTEPTYSPQKHQLVNSQQLHQLPILPQVDVQQVLALQKLISTISPKEPILRPSTPIYGERSQFSTQPTPLAINTGFNPSSVKVEGGFKPILQTGIAPSFKTANERMDEDLVDEDNVEDNVGVIDLTKKESNQETAQEKQDIKEDVHLEATNQTENRDEDIFKHLKPVMFEPMFVPSPPDHRIQKNPLKYKKKPVNAKYHANNIKHRNNHLEPYNAQKNKYIKMRPRPTLIRRPLYPNNVMPPFKIPVRGGSPQFRYQLEDESIENTTDFDIIQMHNDSVNTEDENVENIFEVMELQSSESNSTEPESMEIVVVNTDDGEIFDNEFKVKNDTEDEIAMADERTDFYLPPNAAGSSLTYDGKVVSAIAAPTLPETRRRFDISKQPQFAPFRGELPSLPQSASIADLPQLKDSAAARSDILPPGYQGSSSTTLSRRERRSPDHIPGHVGDDHDHHDHEHHDHGHPALGQKTGDASISRASLLFVMAPLLSLARFL